MSQKRLCLAGHSYWWPSAKWQHEKCVSAVPPSPVDVVVDVKQAVANTVSNKAQRANAGVSNAAAERVKRWRAKGANRDAYNAQQRERMRAVRAARRVSGAAP